MPVLKNCCSLFRKYEPKKVGFKTADIAIFIFGQKKIENV
jgi:hypothetical protein